MQESTSDDAHARAQAQGLERYFRERTVDFVTRLVVGVLLLGGLATAASAGSRRGMLTAALVSVALGAALALASTSRFLAVRRRLRRKPEEEIARLRRHANARLRRFLGDFSAS